jgi:hypothetical protein
MFYFNKFSIRLRKGSKLFPKKKDNNYIDYPVIAMDYEKIPHNNIDNIEGEEDYEEVLCMILIANPINGRFKWININDSKYNSTQLFK